MNEPFLPAVRVGRSWRGSRLQGRRSRLCSRWSRAASRRCFWRCFLTCYRPSPPWCCRGGMTRRTSGKHELDMRSVVAELGDLVVCSANGKRAGRGREMDGGVLCFVAKYFVVSVYAGDARAGIVSATCVSSGGATERCFTPRETRLFMFCLSIRRCFFYLLRCLQKSKIPHAVV